jgi:hypothetical protein
VAEYFQELELSCPRCRAPHQARAFDRAYRTDWIVECGRVRIIAVSPPPRHGRVPTELLDRVRRDLERMLAAESEPA